MRVSVLTAVQEERQRGKERGENEVESTSSFNDDMPVDKILDAELAVEPKTETYSDGSPGNSVSVTDAVNQSSFTAISETQAPSVRRVERDGLMSGI